MDLMSAAGASTNTLLAITVVGGLLVVAFAVLAAMGKRVPMTAYVSAPIGLCIVGALVSSGTASDVLGTLPGVSAEELVPTAFEGFFGALGVDYAARWFAAFLLVGATWASALGAAVAAGSDVRWTPRAAGLSLVVSVGGAIGLMVFASSKGLGGDASMLAGVVLLGGLGVTCGAARRALYEEAHRVAGMRFASCIAYFLAVSAASSAVSIGHTVHALGPAGVAAQSVDLASAITLYAELAQPVFVLGWLAMAIGFIVASCGVFWELGEVVARETVVDVWASCVLFLVLFGATSSQQAQIDKIHAVATNRPATVLYAEVGSDLTASLLTVESEATEVRLETGGFGDVLVWDGEAEQWARAYAWDGSTWQVDCERYDPAVIDKPGGAGGIECDAFEPSGESGVRPLLTMSSSDAALPVVRMLEQLDEGRALLLLRAAEVKAEVIVPDELAYMQSTFFEVRLSESHDLLTDVWTRAGDRRLMWGPTYWYGEEEGEEPLVYSQAVMEETESAGLHLLVDERSQVRDLVNHCLPVVRKVEDGSFVNTDAFCNVTALAEDADPEEARTLWNEWRDEAAEVWELPTSEYTSMKVTPNKELEAFLGGDLVSDRLLREMGAIEWCLNMLRDEGELIEGELKLNVTVGKKGRLSTEIHERSKITDSTFARCATQRFKLIEFEVEEEEEEDGEEEEEDTSKKAPPAPVAEVVFNLKTPPEYDFDED